MVDSKGKGTAEPQAPKPGGGEPRPSDPQPENAIQATRRSRKRRPSVNESASVERESRGAATSGAQRPSGQSTETDPWTVPASVRDRFVQEGRRFYFPGGVLAFKDQGRRLLTPSENKQVIHSLLEIAQSRGWSEVTVIGTERFREEAWRQARLAGVALRGFQPTEEQQGRLIRERVRTSGLQSNPDSSSGSTPSSGSSDGIQAQALPASVRSENKLRISGQLLEHGKDAYQHDPEKDSSYFVKLKTALGVREIWGKDLQRAVTESLSQPKVGDEVVLQRSGREAVMIRRHEKNEGGEIEERSTPAWRNRWGIESQAYIDQRTALAGVVRDPAVSAKTGVGKHPELAGTYLALRAAQLASESLAHEAYRRQFVDQIRSNLADAIERGEPFPSVRLRERQRRSQDQTRELVR